MEARQPMIGAEPKTGIALREHPTYKVVWQALIGGKMFNFPVFNIVPNETIVRSQPYFTVGSFFNGEYAGKGNPHFSGAKPRFLLGFGVK